MGNNTKSNGSQPTFKLPTGDFKFVIGSHSSCHFKVQGLPEKAAAFKRKGDRLFILDLGTDKGVVVNGVRIKRKKWFEITRYDKIMLCGSRLNLPPQAFLGKDSVNLESTDLKFLLANKKPLCDGGYIRAKSGGITAIMGPSGAGKSVFLGILNGTIEPSKGKVYMNRSIDLHSQYNSVKDFIGFVSQESLMIPELTVYQSLNYRLRLRYPGMDAATRNRLIEETCKELGFEKGVEVQSFSNTSKKANRLNAFLNTVIGSAESGLRGLSGGEKKKAQIAHELLLKPLVLILDEPTSGLSSFDSDQLIKMLSDLARKSDLTIIATIHQPSRDAYEEFDDLLILSYGGKIGYYGAAKYAVSFFESTTGENCGKATPPEFIMRFFPNDPTQCEVAVSRFKDSVDRKSRGSGDYGYIYEPLENKHIPINSTDQKVKKWTGFLLGLRQWFVLMQRNFRVLMKDKTNLMLLFGQVPLIGLLILLAFQGFTSDTRAMDRFARTVYHFDLLKEPIEKEGRSVPVDKFWGQAYKEGQADTHLLSEMGGRQKGAVYFVMIAASIWFGIMGGCKEIVVERHLLERELKSFVSLKSYLSSKLCLLLLILSVQTGVLSFAVAPFLLKLDWIFIIKLWGVLLIVGVASAAMGLCVSSYSPTYRFALTAVPLLLIPQLIFGGLIRPLNTAESVSPWPGLIGAVTVQRWAFQASLNLDSYGEHGVLKQCIAEDLGDASERYFELNMVRYSESSLLELFFNRKWYDPFWGPIGVLIVFTAFFMIASYRRLKTKYVL